MQLAQDTKLHLIGGTITLAGLLFVVWLWHAAGRSVAIAVAGTLFAWALERYQAIRHEGTAEARDLVATALPFWIVAAAAGLYDLLAR